MFWIFQAILLLGFGLEIGLLARAYVTGGLKRYTLLYSYIAFLIFADITITLVDHLDPQDYATVYWFFATGRTLAEFAVIWAVSESIFRPYPLLRSLGRLIAASAAVAFVLLYWGPEGWISQPSATHFLNMIKISAVTKALAIAGILAVARKFRIPLGRNAGGVLLGFVAFYTVSAVIFAAALQFGRSIYENIISWLAPLTFVFLLMIWNVALWKLDPVPAANRSVVSGMDGGEERQQTRIRRLGTTVTRVLWK